MAIHSMLNGDRQVAQLFQWFFPETSNISQTLNSLLSVGRF